MKQMSVVQTLVLPTCHGIIISYFALQKCRMRNEVNKAQVQGIQLTVLKPHLPNNDFVCGLGMNM